MHQSFCVVVFCIYRLHFAFSDSSLPFICPEIVNRKQWGGVAPMEVTYTIIPVENVIIHHTVTNPCSTKEGCSSILQNIQNFHMEELLFHDIGYNFLIGGDGRVYEGAGWHKVGAHTRGYNSRSLGIGFIGDFTSRLPSKQQLKAAKDFLKCGVELRELSRDFKLFGARQVSETKSPGLKLYRDLQNWEHYTESPPPRHASNYTSNPAPFFHISVANGTNIMCIHK